MPQRVRVLPEDKIIKNLFVISNDPNRIRMTHLRSLIGLHQYKLLYKLTRKYLKTGGSVLDWGALNGHFSYFLSHKGFKTTGYSFDDFVFKDFLADPNYKFIKGSSKEPVNLPFKDNSFDGVVSVGVLEHVRETGGEELKNLYEIRRILKPKGYFICYHFPNKYSANEIFTATFLSKWTHTWRYTKADIEDLTKKANLKLLEIGRYGILPRNSASKLPYFIRRSKLIAQIFNYVDNFLSLVLSPFCQNYYFVVKKG